MTRTSKRYATRESRTTLYADVLAWLERAALLLAEHDQDREGR